jgi:hypothetical protein
MASAAHIYSEDGTYSAIFIECETGFKQPCNKRLHLRHDVGGDAGRIDALPARQE